MSNTEAQAERMARAERAFTRHVVEKVSLRDLGPELGVSAETVRQDVKAYQSFLAKTGAEDVDERRASFLAQLDDLTRKALDLFEACKDTKPLAAVGALNTIASLMAHRRAVEGLDMPKQVQAAQDITYRVIWSEDDDPQPDPTHADPTFTVG